MNSNVLKAILAMDSYNRGYGESIRIYAGNATVGKTLGSATIIAQSDFEVGKEGRDAGFYGIAYQLENGEKVISYRGTDELAGDGEIGNDIWNGFLTGSV